jgi:branched-chain amino acid transport system ATP-binding protein
MTMLEIKNLSVRYGRHQALEGVSAKVGKGEICVILGANGAGKSSLLRAIAGADRVAAGSIRFAGEDVSRLRAHQRLRSGIALVPEGRRLFGDLTVEENLLVGQANGRPGPWDVDAVVRAFPMLDALRGQRAANLSGGEQQATAIGRALVCNPRLLLLDEVSLGLAPLAVEDVYRSLHDVIDSGTTVILVEQDLGRALGVADRAICLLEGRVVLEGRAEALTREQVTHAYFGLRNGDGHSAATA